MIIARHRVALLTCLLQAAAPLLAAAPEPGAISSLPKLHSGVPAYPAPLMAVARTPYRIPPLAGKAIGIQDDFGYPAGFSGFVDASIGSIGYPGYRNFSNLDIAYDAEKLCLRFCVPYPVGRKTRANATEPSDALAADDVFEVLIDPRDDQGRSKGPVYRVVGNAGGVCKIDRDLPQIGQPHQPWQAGVKCGSMMWDPMGSWMAAVQIPFQDVGGPPKDGDAWGFQAAIRYADPKITAVLSPSDDFSDRSRFARVRFDAGRRANYRCHWLSEDEIKHGTFCVGGIFSNGGNEPASFDGRVTLFRGDRPLGSGTFAHAAKPLSKYDGDMEPCRFPSQPSGPHERDTVARIVVTDRRAKCIVYDQYVPYWRMAPGERDWLKRHFAKEFTFQIGPYPSCGAIDYAIDCQTLMEALPGAERATVTAALGARRLTRHELALPKDGKLAGTLRVGEMTDGASYEIIAAIADKDGKVLSAKKETFTRKVMPFETAPKAGAEDFVPAPFTPPMIAGNSVSCVGRVYTHGTGGLLESLVADGKEILAAPATLKVKTLSQAPGRREETGGVRSPGFSRNPGQTPPKGGTTNAETPPKGGTTNAETPPKGGTTNAETPPKGGTTNAETPPKGGTTNAETPPKGGTTNAETPPKGGTTNAETPPKGGTTNAETPPKGGTTNLIGGKPTLKARGRGMVAYQQAFTGAGLKMDVRGQFDYDGFYRFTVQLAPQAGPVDIGQCYLELPLRGATATLVEAPVEWMWKDWEKCAGFLDAAQGRLWDSKRFPFAVRERKGNMPPFCWVGDDDRGVCFSCASERGMHNDDALPAAALDREGRAVVFRAWFVNKPLKLDKPRCFEFALQASPFKPLDPSHRLWRCGVSRNDCCYGTHGRYFHTGWGIGYYWPTYGRFLDLAKNAAAIDRVRQSGFDYIAASASSCSECGGTPEYQQFWREWGSALGWDKTPLGPLPEWMDKHMRDSGVHYDRFVSLESASNSCPSNCDYRAWWFQEVARHCQTSMIYQDNPPYGYFYQPAAGYGYTRDDGVREPTCATWNARQFMRRALHVAVKSGTDNPAPGVYPNVCGSAQPGRSFCFRGLTGEYLESDRLPLGTLRVWCSKQWGMNIDWLMQEPTAGATLKYWRGLCSRLFLLDVTSFSRDDLANQASCWLAALDLFWLDDPTLAWHPYFRNPIVKSTLRSTTLVSAYTARDRLLLIVSNQDPDDVVETVVLENLEKHGGGGLKHYYDAETGEEIELPRADALRLHVAGNDFRLVLGFTAPWPFAAKHAVRRPELPAQSSLDARRTLTALCRQLLAGPKLSPVENAHRLTETWVQAIVAEFQSDPANFVYLDAKTCGDVDLGDKNIQTALLYDKRRQVLLAVYFNPTATDRLLKGNAREALNKKVERPGHAYVLDPIRGTSQWNVIDLPAGSGKLELLYADGGDYGGARRGPFACGTMWSNLRKALEARKQEMRIHYFRTHD